MDRESKRQVMRRVAEALAFLGYESSRKQRVFLAGIMGVSYRTAAAWLNHGQYPRDLKKLLSALCSRGIPGHWFFEDGKVPLRRVIEVTSEERQFRQGLAELPDTEQRAIRFAIEMMAKGMRAQQVEELVAKINAGAVERAAGLAQIERLWKFRNLTAV